MSGRDGVSRYSLRTQSNGENPGRKASRPAEPQAPHPSPMLAPSHPRGGGAESRATDAGYVEVLTESQIRRIRTPYEPDPVMTSVVSYPQRCNLWGDGAFHGNCDGTLFKELVQRYRPRSVADPMKGSGTTQHVVEGLNRWCGHAIHYWGSDLAEGFNAVSQKLPGRFDLVWVHPPYWNMVRFGSSAADLCHCATYEEFRIALRAVLKNCFEALKPGGRLAVLVGDLRRHGRYMPIVRDVLNWEGELGELRSIIIKAQNDCRSNSKRYNFMEDVRIMHEYCVVFKRPNGQHHLDQPEFTQGGATQIHKGELIASLLPAELRAKLPAIDCENLTSEKVARVQLVAPWSGVTWYVSEFDGQDFFFGLVEDGKKTELGIFSISHIDELRGPNGERVERHEDFKPTKLSNLRNPGPPGEGTR